MKVSIHARGQLLGRMPAAEAVAIIGELERAQPPQQDEARIVRRFGEQRSDGQSNGDILVVIIKGGQVITAYWRRGTQPFSGGQFEGLRLRDMTRTAEQQATMDRVANEKAVRRLQKAWGAR